MVVFCNPILQIFLTCGPSNWALASGCSPLFSLILLYVSQHRSLTAIGQKKASSHSLVLTRDTCNRDELRPHPPGHYLNNGSHGQTLKSTPGQAKPITQYFFNNYTTRRSKKQCCSTISPERCVNMLYFVNSSCLLLFLEVHYGVYSISK